MDYWVKNEKGELVFNGGKSDWAKAAEIAGDCLGFVPDDEDEQVAQEEVSCYNCRFRRWTKHSFICMKR